MGRIRLAWTVLVTAASIGGSACAMSSPDGGSPNCRVVGGEKLPADSGGARALCAAIERAVAAAAPGVPFEAEVRVLPNSVLAARVTANGRALHEQKFASMDRPLDSGSFEQFARALAGQVAETRR